MKPELPTTTAKTALADEYEWLHSEPIFKGATCSVHRAIEKHGKRPVTIKVYEVGDRWKSLGLKEVEILTYLHLKAGYKNDEDGKNSLFFAPLVAWREDPTLNTLFLVFPGGGVSLRDFLESQSEHLQAEEVLELFHCLVLGLDFFHNLGLIHTDIKPENIILTPAAAAVPARATQQQSLNLVTLRGALFRVQYIDFGSATFENATLNPENTNSCDEAMPTPPVHNMLVSTRSYRAPEVNENKCWSYGIDVWSLGCVVFETLFGQKVSAEQGLDYSSAMLQCCRNPVKFQCLKILTEMLELDPIQRLSAHDLKSNPIFECFISKASLILPLESICSSEATNHQRLHQHCVHEPFNKAPLPECCGGASDGDDSKSDNCNGSDCSFLAASSLAHPPSRTPPRSDENQTINDTEEKVLKKRRKIK